MSRYLNFALFITVALSVFFGMHAYILKRASGLYGFHTTWHWWLAVAVAVLLFPVPSILSAYAENRPVQWAYAVSMVYLGAIWLALAILLVYHPFQYLLPFTKPAARVAIPVLLAVLVAASLINATRLRVREVTIAAPGLTRPFRIAQITDVHLGAAHGRDYLERIVAAARAVKPDLYVVTGDLFDGTGRVTADTLAPLADLGVPAFMVLGNHEMYTDLPQTLATIAATPLRLLRNERADVDGLSLIGIDNVEHGRDAALSAILAGFHLDPGRFNLLFFHQPMAPSFLAAHGINLQLAGHTHAGQIFPFNYIVRLFYPAVRGLHTAGGAALYVSPGSGGWGPPMRLGSVREVTIVNLRP